MKSLNKERLEMMRVMLERVVHRSWHMTTDLTKLRNRMTVNQQHPVKVTGCELKNWRNVSGCGYAACAIGHACFDAEFNKLGLIWDGTVPEYRNDRGWGAVDKFFGFEHYKTASILFQADGYKIQHREQVKHLPADVRQAKMVALRIEALQSMTEAEFIEQYQAFYTR